MERTKEEKYQYLIERVTKDVFYDDAVCSFKEEYSVGIGTANMKRVFADTVRKEKLKIMCVKYIDYLKAKNQIKDEDKILDGLFKDSFKLFANLAFNKKMYPDASLEKYINEAPEITDKMKELLIKPLPEVLLNIKGLRKNINKKYSIYNQEEDLMEFFSHTSIAHLIENTFLERFNAHCENDRDICSEQNNHFLDSNFPSKLVDSFIEFPKAKKVLKTINLSLIDYLAEILMLVKDEDKFNEKFNQLVNLWKNTAIAYHNEDLISGHMEEVFTRYFLNKDPQEIEKKINLITAGIHKGENANSLKKLIEDINPTYLDDLLKERNALTDDGNEQVFRRVIKIKENYAHKVIKDKTFFKKISGANPQVGCQNLRIDDEYYYQIYFITNKPLNNLSLEDIIGTINAANETTNENTSVKDDINNLLRTLILKNEMDLNNQNIKPKKKL